MAGPLCRIQQLFWVVCWGGIFELFDGLVFCFVLQTPYMGEEFKTTPFGELQFLTEI